MIGTDPKKPSGNIISKRYGLVGLTANGWQYSDKGFQDDPSLTVM